MTADAGKKTEGRAGGVRVQESSVLVLEKDEQQGAQLRNALQQISQGKLQVEVLSSLGAASLRLKEGPLDLVIFNLEIPVSQQSALEAVDGLQFAWFLSRRYPQLHSLALCQSESDLMERCQQAGATAAMPLPSTRATFLEVARRACELLNLEPAQERAVGWWESSEWIVCDAAGDVLASYQCEDEELRADLLQFLALKARQLSASLNESPVHLVSLHSDGAVLEMLALSEGRSALTMRLTGAEAKELPSELTARLDELGLTHG